jgi:hypothetical protein
MTRPMIIEKVKSFYGEMEITYFYLLELRSVQVSSDN